MKIQTTHVGSLPRPTSMVLRQLRKEEVSTDDLRQYVRETIDRQLALGLSYINNGELPRADYIDSTVQRISGFDETGLAPLPKDLEELPELSRRFSGRNGLITLNPKAPVKIPACSSELGYVGEAALRHELDMVTQVFEEEKKAYPQDNTALFFTAPSPGTLALFLENRYYPDDQDYLRALGDLLRKEYEIIHSYGLYLQIDCPDLAMGRHTTYKHLDDAQFLRVAETNIDVLNEALRNISPAACRAHICWGNYPGTHHCDVELRTIYGALMKLRPRYISLESCNHRHAHEWELFKDVRFPDDKVLMPGVIDTTSNTVEHPDLVCQRLLNFARALGAERVIGSTDCGFASTASAAGVTNEVAWLKLAALTEGARRAGDKL
jgi:5-methyltetrahydropteroyltriglutamate--homocysteine methyltransferase